MTENTIGLILRTRPLTETSLIVHWLTSDFGRIATVAKGARRSKSSFAGKLDLFYLANISFMRSRRSELHTLREASLRELHPELRKDMGYLQHASYAAALVEQCTEMDTPLPEIFGLMTGFLKQLPAHPPLPQMLFSFELKLLCELGLQPDAENEGMQPDIRQLLRVLQISDWPSLARIKLSASQVTGLKQFLHEFLVYHLGRIPATRGNLFR